MPTLPLPQAPKPPPLALAVLVGAIVAVAMLWRPRVAVEPMSAPAEPQAVWATDVEEWGPGWLRMGLKAAGPLPGQKRPPCTPVRERVLVGACWIATEHKPPCPEGVYEVEERCVVPVEARKRPDTSLDR